MLYTPLFRDRCNSLLRYLSVVGPQPLDSVIRDEMGELNEAVRVVDQLSHDDKIDIVPNNHGVWSIVVINSNPYIEDKDLDLTIHPLVLDLAGENPANEENLRIYRKNLT